VVIRESELKAFFGTLKFWNTLLPQPDEPPNLGDDYQIIELIDSGGQALVYKAHQKSLNKTVAIKVQRQSASHSDPEAIQREAQRAARLRHPHIVPVHHVGEHQGCRFCVMESIEGENLATRIQSRPISSKDAAQFVKTIAEAIHYAHQRELLHCDLKPRNILLDEDGKPYVADFGMAKRFGEVGVGGTAGYMAPEQIRGAELTTATDVYGLGAILYTLLTGDAPFRADTVAKTLRFVCDERPVPPVQRNRDVEPDLDAICLKCLHKDADKRYASASELARDLERYLKGEETTARSWSRRKRAAAWYRRNPALAGSMTAAIVVSLVTAVIAVSIARGARQAQLEETLRSNTAVARALANTALLQVRDWARIVQDAASSTALRELMRQEDRSGLQRYVQELCAAESYVCASCGIRNLNGVSIARAGDGADRTTGTSSGRDYFQGALAHAGSAGLQSVHISKVYVSMVDALHKSAISAPISDERGKTMGVILMSVTTDAALARTCELPGSSSQSIAHCAVRGV
jgi:serine/threonine-protein kinase